MWISALGGPKEGPFGEARLRKDLADQEERRKIKEEREAEKVRLELERRKRMAKLMKLKKGN